jgi:hypothetical protein
MTAEAPTHSFAAAQPSDLPPEVSALIDGAIARMAGPAKRQRPVVPIVHRQAAGVAVGAPRLSLPKRRSRVPASEDLVLVSLLFGLVLAAWISLMIGFNVAQAGERTTSACIAPVSSAAGPALDRKFCDRLPRQG